MIHLPIVDRELRVSARRNSTYWTRAGFALAAIIFGFFVYLATYGSPARMFADNLFGTLLVCSILYCLTSGIRATADCLSEEKREGTLGLLFLTDLKGYDVVFGKMAATSLGGFYSLLAIFPILALPLMLGGVTNGEFWRVVLSLVDMFLFSQALGILVSSMSQKARKAMAATLIPLVLLCIVVPTIAAIFRVFIAPGTHSADFILLPSPISSLFWMPALNYARGTGFFWASVGISWACTGVFLVLASIITPRSWQDKPGSAAMRRWRELRHNWSFGTTAQRLLFRRRLLNVNAFYWLAGRVRQKPAQVWTILGALALLWLWGSSSLGSEWFNEGVYFPTALILNSILKFWIASEAGRQLGEDRKLGALELVLSTPLTVKDILRGQWLALRRQFLAPLVMIIGVELVFLAASLQRQSFQDNPINPTLWLAAILMLLADATALGWVAMWTALTSRSQKRVTSMVVLRILVAPWVIFVAAIMVAGSINEIYHLSLPPPSWQMLLALWFVPGILIDAAFTFVAWRQLTRRFRQLALPQFGPNRVGFLTRWWSARRVASQLGSAE